MLGSLLQELGDGGEIPIRVPEMSVAQITREDRYTPAGAPPAPLPTQQDATGERVTQVMEPHMWAPVAGNHIVGQMWKRLPNCGGTQRLSTIRNEKESRLGKVTRSSLGVTTQRWQR